LLIEKDAKLPDQRRSHFVAAAVSGLADGHLESSKAASTVSRSGRRAAMPVSATIPYFCPTVMKHFGQMSALEKHGLPPHGKGLSHAPAPS